MIGYDLLNEPFGDEVTEIGPLYQDVAQRIRKHDPDGILFIEPQVWCMPNACVVAHPSHVQLLVRSRVCQPHSRCQG